MKKNHQRTLDGSTLQILRRVSGRAESMGTHRRVHRYTSDLDLKIWNGGWSVDQLGSIAWRAPQGLATITAQILH